MFDDEALLRTACLILAGGKGGRDHIKLLISHDTSPQRRLDPGSFSCSIHLEKLSLVPMAY